MYQYILVLIFVYFRKDTLEKTSNKVKFYIIINFRELLNKYLRWGRSRANGFGSSQIPRLRLRNPDNNKLSLVPFRMASAAILFSS